MKQIFTIVSAVLLAATAWAQSPEKMSCQAVIRNSSNQLVTNQEIGMQISILQSSVTGTSVYVETQTTTTNVNGLVTIEIGTGITTYDFSAIDWANGIYFIKTETDPTGGTNYTITGTSQLLSVPYALHAKSADNFTGEITIIETDPVYSNSQASDITSTDIVNLSNLSGTNTGDQDISAMTHTNRTALNAISGVNTGDQDLSSFISSESDPTYTSSQAANITTTDITNLSNLSGTNTGDQDISGISTNTQAIKDTASQIRSDIPDVSGFISTESDPVFTGSEAHNITATDITNLGNLSGTNTGNQDISGISTNTQAIKDTASQIRSDIPDVSGFISSESDPVFTGSQAHNITATDITNLGNLSGINTGDQDLSIFATKIMLYTTTYNKSQIDSLFQVLDLAQLSQTISLGGDLSTLLSTYTVEELLNAGATVANLLSAGATIIELVEANAPVSDMLNAGITIDQLVTANENVTDMILAGITVAQLVTANESVTDMLLAGITVTELVAENESVSELLLAGVTVADLIAESVSVADLVTAGASVIDLFNEGITVAEIISVGGSINGILGSEVDQNGNIFNWIGIGNQVWMSENLKTTKTTSGIAIALVTDATNWNNLAPTDKAYCYYNNSTDSLVKYGALYTYATALDACPSGWHLPSNTEFTTLKTYVENDYSCEGSALRSTIGWGSNDNGSDIYGFTALPGGFRAISFSASNYSDIGTRGYWWSATQFDTYNAYYSYLGYNDCGFYTNSYYGKVHGMSVRCVKN